MILQSAIVKDITSTARFPSELGFLAQSARRTASKPVIRESKGKPQPGGLDLGEILPTQHEHVAIGQSSNIE
jgi:hypothetical protein